MNQSIVEKIVSHHAGQNVCEDQLVVVPVDGTLASDTTAPLAIAAFQDMGGQSIWDPSKCFLVLDHATPAPNARIANLHMGIREFSRRQHCKLYESGEGICHQLMIENKHVKPGDIFIGADSHTCTYGAVGALGIGVGSTDLAAVWRTGQIWLRVPKTLRIRLDGNPPPGVSGKDIVLTILGKTGIAGATYQAIEFYGQAAAAMTLSTRMTISNMAIEAGAKTAFFHPDGLNLDNVPAYIASSLEGDRKPDIIINCASVVPMISAPHSPAMARPVGEVDQVAINYGFIGSCVNGRLEDLRAAANVLKGAAIHPNTRLVVSPASRNVFLEGIKDGTIETLVQAGATIIAPGCGPCVGTLGGIPGDGETVISSANRNFKGRMGNPNAAIYLASAATVAASLREGKVSDPRKYFA